MIQEFSLIHNPRSVVNDYYYNEECGLIAFEDEEEVLWVLEE